MSRRHPNLLLALALLLAAAPATAADPNPTPAAEHQEVILEPETSTGEFEQPRTSPTLLEDIDAAKQSYREELAKLTAAFQKEAEPGRAMEIQHRIQSLKWNSQLEMLRIQARHAELVGMEDLAAEANRVIANMESHATDVSPAQENGEGSK